jgi:prenylcysteine oxidase/farnesylcysteine lyase
MRSISLFFKLALLWAPLCHAFRPFGIGNIRHVPDSVTVPSPRIAIIGAGAGGSSAAFWISKAKERHGLDVAIDVFERSDYVGGRKLNIFT